MEKIGKIEKLYLSTKNKHKIDEIKAILTDIDILTFDTLPDIEETGKTFKENAEIKALYLSNLVDEYVIADDSGLICNALIDKPGILSARYAGINAEDNDNIIKLLDDIKDITNRSAYFICHIALARKGSVISTFEGRLDGEISYTPKGKNGFGYDPIFLLSDGSSLAEYDTDKKNMISHRMLALLKLKNFIIGNIF